MSEVKRSFTEWCGGELSVEVGRLANQADGSVFVRYRDTCLLVAVTAERLLDGREEKNFASGLALVVNFLSRSYAVGKIPGGFFKREGKATDRDTLASRVIDRAIRPLIPDGMVNEVNIVCKLMSYDGSILPEILALVGASIALYIAGVPFNGPVVGINVMRGKKEDNELRECAEDSDSERPLDLFVACNRESITMIEAGASEVSEDYMLQAISDACCEAKHLIKFIEDFQSLVGYPKRTDYHMYCDPDLEREILEACRGGFLDAYSDTGRHKCIRNEMLSSVYREALLKFSDRYSRNEVEYHLGKVERDLLREKYLKDRIRIDGRDVRTVREIEVIADFLPKTHGSAVFTRGGTQVLSVVTLGSFQDEQMVDDFDSERRENFLLHYNFLPYAVGEVGQLRPPGRREVGHGRLALKAISGVLPCRSEFPYTIRVVSEVTGSDGSSSMATVCSASLALMDSGAPMKGHVAGIAMGVIKGDNDYVILSDISGREDGIGNMDFKIAGTARGITAMQMDVKGDGINLRILESTLSQALDGRLGIIDEMNSVSSAPRCLVKDFAPKIVCCDVPKNMMHKVIGPSGKTIKGICEDYSVKIDTDDGKLYITSTLQDNLSAAKERIDSIVNIVPLNVGGAYQGIVVSVVDFGLFVEIVGTSQQGLLHISEITRDRGVNIRSLYRDGDKVSVEVKEITSDDKIRLSLVGGSASVSSANDPGKKTLPVTDGNGKRGKKAGATVGARKRFF